MNRPRTVVVYGSLVALLGGAPGGAVEKPLLPEQVYFQAGDGLYLFDYTSVLDAVGRNGVPAAGCQELRVKQAVVAGASPARGFAFSAIPSAAEMVYLGSSAADVRRKTGVDLTQVQIWAPVVTHRLCRSASGVRVEQDTGADRVSYTFPWEVAAVDSSAAPTDVSIEIGVNGRTERIAAGRVLELSRKLASGSDLAGEPLQPEFLALGSHLNDPSAYGRTLYGLLWATAAIDVRHQWPPSGAEPLNGSCGWNCFQCSILGAGLITGGTAMLVVGCGASVGTLGASCLGAAAGYITSVLSLMDKCLDCCMCAGSCGGGKGGGGGGDKGGGPGECPYGYHMCCGTYQCCSDVNPPACCTPPCN